jgi:hypothetical protein
VVDFLKKKFILLLFFGFSPKKMRTHFDVDRDTQHDGIELCHKALGQKDAAFF